MLDQSLLYSFRMTAAERNLCVYGVHVYKKGEGCVEHRFRNDDFVNLYSASKTFTSVGVGICRDEGGLKLTDKVISFFPEYESVAAKGTEDITLTDLLHMASGKELAWTTPGEEDVAGAFFREPLSRRPGEHFFYSNFCTYMLGRVVEKVSGQKLRDYLIPRLFKPLDIFNPQWQSCPQGHTVAATGLFLHTSELARLGRTLLHKGEYEGKRIVSEDYVNLMHTDTVSSAHWTSDAESASGYGYQVWNCTKPGVYRADGMYGQFSIVIPDKDAVITLTSHREYTANDIIRSSFTEILPLL
ncbi:MAG: beta-lactamase family protein [Clostridiales bacterium]|jgi:CubicO group peptidase (beta-lactamase class C family)|nr:beta-lactamase family protein [Clostridiales bacterium]